MTSEITPTFEGNNTDLISVAGLVSSGLVLLTCATCGQGLYCLPVVPAVLGLIGLLSADDSVDPERTRRYSWISIGIGGGMLLLVVVAILATVLLYFGVAAAAFSAQQSTGGGLTP